MHWKLEKHVLLETHHRPSQRAMPGTAQTAGQMWNTGLAQIKVDSLLPNAALKGWEYQMF